MMVLRNSPVSPGKDDPSQLEYGKSITDACINWDDSVKVLERLAKAVKKRRSQKK